MRLVDPGNPGKKTGTGERDIKNFNSRNLGHVECGSLFDGLENNTNKVDY